MSFTQDPYRYKKIERVVFRPGNFYQFRYLNYENDPEPLIYYLNYRNAINEDTGRLHRYIQGINFHYIPMGKRLTFVTNWLNFVEKNKSFLFSNFLQIWKELKRRYGFLEVAYRRYLTEPTGLIKNVSYIKRSLVVPMVKGSIEKDFSFYERYIFMKKYREFNKLVSRNCGKTKLLKRD